MPTRGPLKAQSEVQQVRRQKKQTLRSDANFLSILCYESAIKLLVTFK